MQLPPFLLTMVRYSAITFKRYSLYCDTYCYQSIEMPRQFVTRVKPFMCHVYITESSHFTQEGYRIYNNLSHMEHSFEVKQHLRLRTGIGLPTVLAVLLLRYMVKRYVHCEKLLFLLLFHKRNYRNSNRITLNCCQAVVIIF